MVTLLFGKIRFHVSIILLSLLTTISLNSASGKPGHSGYRKPEPVVSNLIEEVYKLLHIDDTPNKQNQTQTTAYLNRDTLRKNLDRHYSYNINSIGKRFFEDLFKSAIQKEVKFANNYRVFYHGQDRVFMLFQDVHEQLYNLANKRTLKDFIMLRTLDKDFTKFTSTQSFLKHCIKNGDLRIHAFDHQPHIKNNYSQSIHRYLEIHIALAKVLFITF